MTINFFVPGIPQPGGSKRAFVIPAKGGRPARAIVTEDAKRNRDWRASVALAAHVAMGAHPPFIGALKVTLAFYLPRPRGHFNARYELRLSAPQYHLIKPDVLKLARSTEDAMTQIAWIDDKQIVSEALSKSYSGGYIASAASSRTGCAIIVEEL